MKLTRRQFVKNTAIGAAGILAYKANLRSAYAFYQSPRIPLFGTTLRGVGPGGIPVAAPDALPAPVTGVTHYTIDIRQFQDAGVCPKLGPTTLWGYHPANTLGGGFQQQKHLGGIIVGRRNQPIQITFRNQLNVTKHILPVDTSIPGANQAVNRVAVHLHGGLVPWISDGGPFDWFDPYGNHGLSFLNNEVLNPGAPGGSAEYYYPMNQSARFMWYHDHAFGITRLNAYAGIATALIIRDDFEAGLIALGLPKFVEEGGNEIPLVFQDKVFVGPNIGGQDRLWKSIVSPDATKPGSIWYAHTYDPSRWDLGPGIAPPDPSCIPEFFGDTMLVNGTAFPKATVEARRYRLRMLNACNARFLNLQLYVADDSPEGISLDSVGQPKNEPFLNSAAGGTANFLQIGNEAGFLASPALVSSSTPLVIPPDVDPDFVDPDLLKRSLLLAPAERPDVLVDFSGYEGKSIILYNDAPAPFPFGDDGTDFFPGWNLGTEVSGIGNAANTPHHGYGPNTRVLMRFDVVAARSADPPLDINTGTDLSAGIDPFLDPAGKPRRLLTLNEDMDEYGRLRQVIGNAAAIDGSPYEGQNWEGVHSGDVEVWEIYNRTGDVHPMHFHLFNVQVVNRQVYAGGDNFNTFLGPEIPPEPNERGWKETVPMYPGTVTRVLMRFDLAQIKTAQGAIIATPESPRTRGNEFVWHCHILEHEEHDMMHALVVT